MTAGMGDGGSCSRDNIVQGLWPKELDLGYDIFDSVMTAREVQAKICSLYSHCNKIWWQYNFKWRFHKPGGPI